MTAAGISAVQATEALHRLTVAMGGPYRTDPRLWSAAYVDELRRRLRGRTSWRRSRRRRAHAAVLELIRWHEAINAAILLAGIAVVVWQIRLLKLGLDAIEPWQIETDKERLWYVLAYCRWGLRPRFDPWVA